MTVSRAEKAPLALTSVDDARLARAERRDVLLDGAAALVAAGRVDEVSMESVAVAAGVSRGLVYKHFANRHELLSALYERESAHLHSQLAFDVNAGTDLASMLRALVRGSLAAQAQRGATFAALASSGGRDSRQRERQRRRDGRTLQHFSRVAAEEFDLERDDARTALAVTLGSVATVLALWRRRPTAEYATQLEEVFVAMAMGGLDEMRRRSRLSSTEQ